MYRPWWLLLLVVIGVAPQVVQLAGLSDDWKGRAKTAGDDAEPSLTSGKAKSAAAAVTQAEEQPAEQPSFMIRGEEDLPCRSLDEFFPAMVIPQAWRAPEPDRYFHYWTWHDAPESDPTPGATENPLIVVGPIPLEQYFKAALSPLAPSMVLEDVDADAFQAAADALRATKVYIIDKKTDGAFGSSEICNSGEEYPKLVVAKQSASSPIRFEFSLESVPADPQTSLIVRKVRIRAVVTAQKQSFCRFRSFGLRRGMPEALTRDDLLRTFYSDVVSYDINGVLRPNRKEANLQSIWNCLDEWQCDYFNAKPEPRPEFYSIYHSGIE